MPYQIADGVSHKGCIFHVISTRFKRKKTVLMNCLYSIRIANALAGCNSLFYFLLPRRYRCQNRYTYGGTNRYIIWIFNNILIVHDQIRPYFLVTIEFESNPCKGFSRA